MEPVHVTLRLDPETLLALRRIAQDERTSVGHVVRAAIGRDLYRRARARRADRPDERRVAPLRALLARDFAEARGWTDLQIRLAAHGYALRAVGGGLALHRRDDGARVAKASDLGWSYQRLMDRFGVPFPGHSHRHLQPRCA